MIRLLAVDDSALVRRLLAELFGGQGDFAVEFAQNGEEALHKLRSFQPDVVTLDVQMPRMDGLACLDRIMLERPCPVVMVSSLTQAGAEATLEALALGAVAFVPKPEGTLSLAMDEFGPALVETVRAAATAKLRVSRRLAERVRLQANPAEAAHHGATRTEETRRIVLVGCSTGGPPALDALLTPLPADFPWPILVAQHMPASFTGPLAERLDRECALTVSEVRRPVPLVPGNVYVGRGDADLIVSRRAEGLVAMAAPALAGHVWRPSVDRLVQSAMRLCPASQLVGVLMTGMGYDGAAAMAKLHAEGGATIAEAEETAVIWGMPRELVEAGGASVVVPVDAIAHQLMRWAA